MGFVADAVGSVVGAASDAIGAVSSALPEVVTKVGLPALAYFQPELAPFINGFSAVTGLNSLATGLLSGGSPAPGGTASASQMEDIVQQYEDAGYTRDEALGFIGQSAGTDAGTVQGIINGGGTLNFAPQSDFSSVSTGGQVGNGIGSTSGTGLISSGLGFLGQYLNNNAAKDAATTSSLAQVDAARLASDAAKFRPVGITSNFGTSKFGFDSNGYNNSAGYVLSPQIQSQQNGLMNLSNGLLPEYFSGQQAPAQMATGAQRLFDLGHNYLSTTPQAQAQKWYADQMALLQPGNDAQYANLQNTMANQGRGGLAVGGGNGMLASNPELNAYYNAIEMQRRNLAADATTQGQNYAKFGAGLLGTGSDLLNSMYQTQSNAIAPYSTSLSAAQTLEGLGQNTMDEGINIGAKGATANGTSGQLLFNGLTDAARTMQPANSVSPWGGLLTGMSNQMQTYQQPTSSSYMFNPYTGVRL